MRNAGLDEAQAGIKIAGRNITNLRYADDTTLLAESEEELKSLLMKVKEESEKVGLSSVLAREGAGCGSVGDVPGAWLASAPLSPSLWIHFHFHQEAF